MLPDQILVRKHLGVVLLGVGNLPNNGLHPFSAGVPISGQTTLIASALPPEWDWSPKKRLTIFVTYLLVWCCSISSRRSSSLYAVYTLSRVWAALIG